TMNQTRAKGMALLLGVFLTLPAAGLLAQSNRDTATKATQPPPAIVKAPATGDLTRRIEELEKQVVRLNREIEQLKGAPAKPADQEPKADFEIIALKYVAAKEISPLIGNLFRGKTGFSIIADGNTNSLIVRGTPAD